MDSNICSLSNWSPLQHSSNVIGYSSLEQSSLGIRISLPFQISFPSRCLTSLFFIQYAIFFASLALYYYSRISVQSPYNVQFFRFLYNSLKSFSVNFIGISLLTYSWEASHIIDNVSKTFNNSCISSNYFPDNFSCPMKSFTIPLTARPPSSDLSL